MSTILDKLELYKDYLDTPVAEAIKTHETEEYQLRVKQHDPDGALLEWLVLLPQHYTAKTQSDGSIAVDFHISELTTMPHAPDKEYGGSVLCLYGKEDNMLAVEPLAKIGLLERHRIMGNDSSRLGIHLPKNIVFPQPPPF